MPSGKKVRGLEKVPGCALLYSQIGNKAQRLLPRKKRASVPGPE